MFACRVMPARVCGMGLPHMIAVVALASHSGDPEDVHTHIANIYLPYCNRCIALECAMMSFGLRSVVCTWGFILSLGLTTHAPVAHSSPRWLVSLAQRAGLGIVGPGVSSRQQGLSACSASHVCAGVCAPCICIPIHVCPSAQGTHGYDKP